MSSSKMSEIPLPPADLELGFPRKPLKYYYSIPSNGIGKNTGVILFICPWGMNPEHSYCQDVLLPRLAEKYDCVVAVAAYFGIGVKLNTNPQILPPNGFEGVIRRALGDEIAKLPVGEQLQALVGHGYKELPKELPFTLNYFPEYESFGLMPALDNIAVLADLLQRFPVRRDRLHCFGSSYGGYVACMMLKILPNTFHLMVDNSGFAKAKPDEMSNAEFNVHHWLTINGLRVPFQIASPWNFTDPAAARFVDTAILAIRDCTVGDHFLASKTLLRSYCSVHDRLISIELKREFWSILKNKMDVRGVEVDHNMVDGSLFKNVDHGMNASLLDLFDDAMRGVPYCSADSVTDFDRGSNIEILSSNRQYRFLFKDSAHFTSEIIPAD